MARLLKYATTEAADAGQLASTAAAIVQPAITGYDGSCTCPRAGRCVRQGQRHCDPRRGRHLAWSTPNDPWTLYTAGGYEYTSEILHSAGVGPSSETWESYPAADIEAHVLPAQLVNSSNSETELVDELHSFGDLR